MNEAAAREVVLVQAFETAHPQPPSWSDDDRAWATRLALDEARPGGADAFIARRAHHALQRLGPREPAVAEWLTRRLWRWHWVAWAVLVGLGAGLIADAIGSGQRINLLAPPLWAVLVWNVIVYVLLLGHVVARLFMRKPRGGGVLRLTERVLRIGRRLPGLRSPGATASGSAKALQAFAGRWLRVSAALSAARASTVLHAAAAALGAGLIAGLYLRGLVLDYRAAWESTFLSAESAHAVLSVVLAPALAVSNVVLPDVAAFEAMRAVHGEAAAGASAAQWIHLLALTVLIVVVLPRGLLALAGAARAHWLERHMALPLTGPYFEQLLRAREGEVARVVVVPYASTPSAATALALRALLAKSLGDTVQVEIGATIAFGTEDDADALAPPPAGTTLVVALFDLTATPEAEQQGRFVRGLAAHASTIVMLDETAFAQRFANDAARLAQRRDAWRVLAVELGTVPVFVDAASPDEARADALAQALRRPVRVA
jgi:hypothetical protein